MPPTSKQINQFNHIFDHLNRYPFHHLNFQKIAEKRIWFSLFKSPKQRLYLTHYNIFKKSQTLTKINGDGRYLFYEESYLRADHRANYLKIKSVLCDFNLSVISNVSEPTHYTFTDIIFRLLRFFKIFFKMVFITGLRVDVSTLMCFASEIVILEDFYHHFIQLDITEKCVVLFHDAESQQNLMCQVLKNRGIPTITLQHGLFIDWQYLGQHSFNYENTSADYFFAWGKKTCELLHAKNPSIKFFPVGHPFFIGESIPLPKYKDAFGIILGSLAFREENKELVRFAEIVSRNIDRKYYIKLHPADQADVYQDIMQSNCLGYLGHETSIFDYIQTVDFSITNPSSLLLQLLFMNHLTIKFGPAYTHDPSADEWLSVHDLADFLNMYPSFDQIRDNGPMSDYIHENFEPGNVADNYRNAFIAVLNEL